MVGHEHSRTKISQVGETDHVDSTSGEHQYGPRPAANETVHPRTAWTYGQHHPDNRTGQEEEKEHVAGERGPR